MSDRDFDLDLNTNRLDLSSRFLDSLDAPSALHWKDRAERLPDGRWRIQIHRDTAARLRSLRRAGETDEEVLSRIMLAPMQQAKEEASLIREVVSAIRGDEGAFLDGHHNLGADWKPGVIEEPEYDAKGNRITAVSSDWTGPLNSGAADAYAARAVGRIKPGEAEAIREAKRDTRNTRADFLAAASGYHDYEERAEAFYARHPEARANAEKVQRELEEWFRLPFKMERPDGSAFHRLVECARDRRDLYVPTVGGKVAERMGFGLGLALQGGENVFVIEHDWAAAFANAADFHEGLFNLPYDRCAWDFRVNGRHLVLTTIVGERTSSCLFVENPGKKDWYFAIECELNWDEGGIWEIACHETLREGNRAHEFMKALMMNVRAVVIALEADVAATEITRAPHRLNRAREKVGKPPILDHHVVVLARRHRAAPRLPGPMDHPSERRSPRLHFRRGHWRHYTNHKVWVNWMLVGDPDLGFIDKTYRL